MAQNKVQEGDILRLTVASTVDAGDPVVVGNALPGVALTDYDVTDGKASVAMKGGFDLSVQAVNDAGNSAVVIGDKLFFDGTTISKKSSGKFFGVALEAINAGVTATINVKIGGAAHMVVAAGIHTVADSPLDTDEFIAITGCLDTDVVVATMAVNGGSPKLNIVTAKAATSPAGITITADGTYTAGDKINYLVIRP